MVLQPHLNGILVSRLVFLTPFLSTEQLAVSFERGPRLEALFDLESKAFLTTEQLAASLEWEPCLEAVSYLKIRSLYRQLNG